MLEMLMELEDHSDSSGPSAQGHILLEVFSQEHLDLDLGWIDRMADLLGDLSESMAQKQKYPAENRLNWCRAVEPFCCSSCAMLLHVLQPATLS